MPRRSRTRRSSHNPPRTQSSPLRSSTITPSCITLPTAPHEAKVPAQWTICVQRLYQCAYTLPYVAKHCSTKASPMACEGISVTIHASIHNPSDIAVHMDHPSADSSQQAPVSVHERETTTHDITSSQGRDQHHTQAQHHSPMCRSLCVWYHASYTVFAQAGAEEQWCTSTCLSVQITISHVYDSRRYRGL